MKKKINENYLQDSFFRNDIYRKFRIVFENINNNYFINPDLYVDYENDIYTKNFDEFIKKNMSIVKFFIGFTGVGKTSFLKHYFNFNNYSNFVKDDMLIIPMGWNGRMDTSQEWESNIRTEIVNVIYDAISYIYKDYELFYLSEVNDIIKFIKETKNSILCALSGNDISKDESEYSINLKKLNQSQLKYPIEFACSLLKYVLTNHQEQVEIKKLIFIVDDLESLPENQILFIKEEYTKIWSCLQRVTFNLNVYIIFGLRPHSMRFLQAHETITSPFSIFLGTDINKIYKRDIPNIIDIFKRRFEFAQKNYTPGNQKTWDENQKILYKIINGFDKNVIDMIVDLCHSNIRAISECFIMILSNRVWCQEYSGDFEHPYVDTKNFRFDAVNVIRTLACGENCVYTGLKNIQFNSNNSLDMQSRPSFDKSNVFIPNLLINLNDNTCDILPILIIKYLNNCFSSQDASPMESEFISKKDISDKIYSLFNQVVSSDYVNQVLDYLFENRIIRKCINNKDTTDTLNILRDDEYVYLTKKGSRLFNMLYNDSILLEIFREDICRDYKEEYDISAYQLIYANQRYILFDDLIELAKEIYRNEDKYCICPSSRTATSLYYKEKYIISRTIIHGIEQSLNKSTNLEENEKKKLLSKLKRLAKDVEKRSCELTANC